MRRSKNMDNEEFFSMADELKAAKDEKKELEEQVKEVNARIGMLDASLSGAMTDAECDHFSRNGMTFYLSSRLFASPQSGHRDEMIAALREKGYGSIVTETVNANTLASFVKEQMESNGDEMPGWLEPVVSTYEKVSVGIHKG